MPLPDLAGLFLTPFQALNPPQALTASGSNFASGLQCEFDSITIDSRKTAPGDLFVALVGERLDGHDFLSRLPIELLAWWFPVQTSYP